MQEMQGLGALKQKEGAPSPPRTTFREHAPVSHALWLRAMHLLHHLLACLRRACIAATHILACSYFLIFQIGLAKHKSSERLAPVRFR